MKAIGFCLFLLWAAAPIRANESTGDRLCVGITGDTGVEILAEALGAQTDLEPVLMPSIQIRALARCAVLIVTQKTGGWDEREAQIIHSWVQHGGGLILLHDAVGFREYQPLFPEIGRGTGNPKLDKIKVIMDHPISRGLAPGRVFAPAFQYDHISLENKSGDTVAANEKDDQAVVVAGRAGEGRVVLNGLLTGMGSVPGGGGRAVKSKPTPDELLILVNSIRWAAGR